MVFKVYTKHNVWCLHALDATEADVTRIGMELYGQFGVTRMAYDQWYWLNEDAARKFVTYYTLKYPQ